MLPKATIFYINAEFPFGDLKRDDMTLVARFVVSNVPVLISDMLLSTPAPLNILPIPLPSVRTSEKYHGEAPTTMAGLVQKMTLIDETAVLCFAGEYSLGREVLGYMKRHLKEGQHPEVAWNRMRKHFSLNNYSNLELVFEAMHPAGDGCVEQISKSIGIRGGEKKYLLFDEAIFAGSGAELAKEVLARGDHRGAPQFDGKYELAVQRALHIVAELLDMDMRGGRSFDKHFGGSYEIAIWYGNRFKKIDGVQFVYWTIAVGEIENSLRLDRILLHHYQGEMLCVDEVLTDDSTPLKISLTSEQRLPISNVLHHRIPSLSQGYEAQEFEVGCRTQFQHKITVHCCRLSDSAGSFTTATITSGTIQTAYESETIKVRDSEIVIAKDIGRFLKNYLISGMERYRETSGEEASPKEKSVAKRVIEFFSNF